MKFNSLRQCIRFLKKENDLVVIDQEVDPDLEMAHITRRVFENQGPAVLFSRVKGSKFPAISNLMGTWQRTQRIFEPQLDAVKALIDLKSDPGRGLKSAKTLLKAVPAAMHAIPIRQISAPPVLDRQCTVQDMPLIRCWPDDGGAFILLPQVFSMDPDTPSLLTSNLGMYRIQMSGNEYIPGQEMGLHYQIHRGIGDHHQKALGKNRPFPVSIFIGGPPAHMLAAVMPLPEGMPEIAFAGSLAGRNFRYVRYKNHILSADADFCITGMVMPGKTKPEGPFGDHLGYYSLKHGFPYLKITRIFHRKDPVFPFTVVGRPPQEDSNFGRLIHEISRSAVQKEIPGVSGVNAVDHAGVHPLLLVKASERYVPYEKRKPRELLTHANRILGTGQLSLAKYLFICAKEDNPGLDVNDEKDFLRHILERINLSSDLHFLTQTTMDTLDYSSQMLNNGSKLIIAVAGDKKRELGTILPTDFSIPDAFSIAAIAAPGIVVVKGPGFSSYSDAQNQINELKYTFESNSGLNAFPLFVVVDDVRFTTGTFANFLWVTFTRSDPAHDIYGLDEKIKFKHWQCDPPMIIDARIKPFHAAPLLPDKKIEEKVDRMGLPGGVLHNII